DVAVEIIPLRALEPGVLGVERVKEARGRPGLVVVVHEVHLVRASVRRAVLPVVNNVVPDIEPAGVEMVLVQPARKAPVPAGAMRQQIVMKTANVPADARRVTVLRARRIIL